MLHFFLTPKLLTFVLLLLVFLPLISFLILGTRTKYNYCFYDSPRNTLYLIWLFILLLLLFLLGALYCYLYVLNKNFFFSVELGDWFSTASYRIPWSFVFDGLSISMFFIVYIVSGLVHIYSLSYMKGDPNIIRFLSYLSLFTFFMLWLVSSGNLVQLFIGWEGVGLCSFLLISFWTERVAANKAAVKAMVVNKIGDCFILFGIAFLLQVLGTVDLSIYTLIDYNFSFFLNLHNLLGLQSSWLGYSFDLISVICFLLFLGVMAKSAQFGFHTWLPDAMEGPTPVSALIHAATMVTAGVFLLLRLSVLFSLSPSIQFFMIAIGSLTMFFAGSVALFQNDIKRVIAYSTCSQLGYMVTACGFSFYGAAFFHLLSHAFFKALLFLGAGAIIHFFNDEQDMRRMGGALFYNPVTFVCMFVASLALLGFPYTSGFYSKDYLLELFFVSSSAYSGIGYFFGVFVALLTSFYSFRLLYLVFLQKPNGLKINYFSAHLEDKRISFVLIILFFLTISFGYIYQKYLKIFIFFPFESSVTAAVYLPFYIKILPFLILFVGWFLVHYFYYKKIQIFAFSLIFCNVFYPLYDFLINRWYFDIIQNYWITLPIFKFSHTVSFLGLEKGWIEYLGPTGSVYLITTFSRLVNLLQTRNFFDYLFYLLSFFLAFILFN